jgi:hypothetical protein
MGKSIKHAALGRLGDRDKKKQELNSSETSCDKI